MPRTIRPASSIMVRILDVTTLEESALEYMKSHNHEDAIKAETGYRHGIVTTNEGVFHLCDEGVGDDNPITDDNPVEFFFFQRTENSFAMMPTASIKIGNLSEYVTDEYIPLNEFIRTFGSRLDSNYFQWERKFQMVGGAV
jgi:hypothetical protein